MALFNFGSMTAFVTALIILAFSAGIFFPVLGKAFLRRDSHNILARLFRFLKASSGYIASFGAGALLMAFLAYNNNPYKVAHWSGVYDSTRLGHLIMMDKTAMLTGKIPKKASDWYLANYDPITGDKLM